jgi:hypothetical protein
MRSLTRRNRGLTIGCRGCGAGYVFGGTKVLRPAPLTLVSLGRWAGIAAAAGNFFHGSHAPILMCLGREPLRHIFSPFSAHRQAIELCDGPHQTMRCWDWVGITMNRGPMEPTINTASSEEQEDTWLREEYRLLSEHYFHEDNQCFTAMAMFATLSSGLLAFMGSTFAQPKSAAAIAIPRVGIVICASWIATVVRIHEWRVHIEARAKSIETQVGARWSKIESLPLDIHTARHYEATLPRLRWWQFAHGLFRNVSTAQTLTVLPLTFGVVWVVLLVRAILEARAA